MVAMRSHHHQADRDNEPRNILDIDLPSDEELRITLATESSSYAEWLMTAYPATYQKWLKTRNLRHSGDSSAIVAGAAISTRHEAIGYGSVAIMKPSVPALLTAPQIAGLLPARVSDPEREFKAEIAWLSFGELVDAFVSDFMQATAFMTVYDIDLFWFEALSIDGLTIKAVGRNVTFCGALKLLTECRGKLAVCGVRASEVYREVSFSENLNYRYTWVNGVQQSIPRKQAV